MMLFDLVALCAFIIVACACVPLLWVIRNGAVVAGIRAILWGLMVTAIVMSVFDIVALYGYVSLEMYSSLRKVGGRFPLLIGVLTCLWQFARSRVGTRSE